MCFSLGSAFAGNSWGKADEIASLLPEVKATELDQPSLLVRFGDT